MIGLGRSAVLEPDIPKKVLLNPAYDDEGSVARSHIVKGQWFTSLIPVKVVGSSLAIEFFYYNMRRLGKGLQSEPDISIPGVVLAGIWESLHEGILGTVQRMIATLSGQPKVKSLREYLLLHICVLLMLSSGEANAEVYTPPSPPTTEEPPQAAAMLAWDDPKPVENPPSPRRNNNPRWPRPTKAPKERHVWPKAREIPRELSVGSPLVSVLLLEVTRARQKERLLHGGLSTADPQLGPADQFSHLYRGRQGSTCSCALLRGAR